MIRAVTGSRFAARKRARVQLNIHLRRTDMTHSECDENEPSRLAR